MTAKDLQDLLNSWNQGSFESLERRLGISRKASCKIDLSCGTQVYQLPERECHCGRATRLQEFPNQLRHSRSGESLAVGAVLDEATKGSAADLDVVVAVGINYSQFGASVPYAIPDPDDWAKTRMWRRLGHVLQRLDKDCLNGQFGERYGDIFSEVEKQDPPFHLVAVNYFPWMTQSEWGEISLNAIAESLVLRCWGYDQPAERIADLIASIAAKKPGTSECVGEVPCVIFHGAGNAVPYLALETIRLLVGKCFSNYVFSDNLSRQSQPTNAVALLPLTPLTVRRENVHQVADE